MRTFLLLLLGYVALLLLGLGLPAIAVAQRDAIGTLDLVLYVAALTALGGAAFLGALTIAKVGFPLYWWLAQVLRKDIYEFDGVYFQGLRLTRVPTRLQRLVFGADDRMRRWDLLYGLLVLVLLAPHVAGLVTAHRWYDRVLPNPTRIPETLHAAVLSSLPVMRDWDRPWQPDPALYRRVDRELQLLRMQPRKTNDQRFRLAQYYLLKAFVPRQSVSAPYLVSPGERVFFDRTQGAQAVVYLNQILEQPEAQQDGLGAAAQALVGFFHLADGDYGSAEDFLQQALAAPDSGDGARLPRYEVLLLAAQASMLAGDEQDAITLLEQILVDDRMPNRAYALALEHYAEALRLSGEPRQVPDLLSKALELYRVDHNTAGVARVHLHQAALALDQGRRSEASEALSKAASLATGQRDGFTLNMVERLSLQFSG